MGLMDFVTPVINFSYSALLILISYRIWRKMKVAGKPDKFSCLLLLMFLSFAIALLGTSVMKLLYNALGNPLILQLVFIPILPGYVVGAYILYLMYQGKKDGQSTDER